MILTAATANLFYSRILPLAAERAEVWMRTFRTYPNCPYTVHRPPYTVRDSAVGRRCTADGVRCTLSGTVTPMHGSMEKALADAAGALESFRRDPSTLEAMQSAVRAITAAFKRRGRVLSCGNGGSMCDAMHFAEEFSGRFQLDREPYPAIALSDPAHLTCVANDYGYDFVFSRQVDALGHEGDVLVILSTSGNSPSIVKAAEAAKARGMVVFGCLGKGGGAVSPYCDIVLHAPGERSDRIQELHMLALHAIIEAVEQEMRI